jgi:pimeloyl-ACP methyl ester carboxylesterase
MAARRPALAPDPRTAIVFLHGTRLTGGQWAAQVGALGDEFRCLPPDLPGHGTAAGETFTLAGAAEAVAAVIERDAGGRAILVGLSLGGYVAMDVAARWPDRVAGLVLAGATAEPVRPRALLFEALATAFEEIDEGLLTRINRWFFEHRYPPAIADPILAGGFHFRGGAAALRALVGERFLPRLAAYPGPTLILNGEFDLLFRLSAPAFAAAATDARRVLIRGATHLTNIDQPALVTAAIRRFAREVVDPPA